MNMLTNGLAALAIFFGGIDLALAQSAMKVVTYEDFGAVGDGITDDMPAIQKAHEHANENGLPVSSKPDATYHLGRRGLTAVIATDTNWGTSKFIIDDSNGVEKSSRPVFEVVSLLKAEPVKIDQLKRGQNRLNIHPPRDVLVYVENDAKRLFIRKGGNQNSGTAQKEVFVLKKDGGIIGAIEWDYDQITEIITYPIDDAILTVSGGIFTSIANQADPEDQSSYWSRNISVKRSKTMIDGLTHKVTGEKEHGHPYRGFLSADRCAYVMFRNCVVDAKKTYYKPGKLGGKVPMGSYGYHANLIVDFRMMNCRMGNDIHDRSRWGVVATNFMKNFLVENCVLSRVDVHMGVSGFYTIKDSTLGHAGLNAIGRGQLIVENSTIHSGRFINFREDYGSTWEGDVMIRNSRWIPPNKNPTMFAISNNGSHDFGYPCFMPETIRIENLIVEEPKGSTNIDLLGNPVGKANPKSTFPIRMTKTIEIRGLTSTSGKPPRVSTNPEVVKTVQLLMK